MQTQVQQLQGWLAGTEEQSMCLDVSAVVNASVKITVHQQLWKVEDYQNAGRCYQPS
jgi:hypothetical protein